MTLSVCIAQRWKQAVKTRRKRKTNSLKLQKKVLRRKWSSFGREVLVPVGVTFSINAWQSDLPPLVVVLDLTCFVCSEIHQYYSCMILCVLKSWKLWPECVVVLVVLVIRHGAWCLDHSPWKILQSAHYNNSQRCHLLLTKKEGLPYGARKPTYYLVMC